MSKCNQEEVKKDPFMLLGFGMIAYRDLMLTLAILFGILSIAITPAFVYYSQWHGIPESDSKMPYASYSLGNMGYSVNQCQVMPLGSGSSSFLEVPMNCAFNESQLLEVSSKTVRFGVNPLKVTNNICNYNSENQVCVDQMNTE